LVEKCQTRFSALAELVPSGLIIAMSMPKEEPGSVIHTNTSAEDVVLISDESTNKTFLPLAAAHLTEASNRGVSGKMIHAAERRRLAQSLNVDMQRITVKTKIRSELNNEQNWFNNSQQHKSKKQKKNDSVQQTEVKGTASTIVGKDSSPIPKSLSGLSSTAVAVVDIERALRKQKTTPWKEYRAFEYERVCTL
jgi:hypothetical protein